MISSLYPPTWPVIYLLLLSSLVIRQFTVCLTDLTLQHHASIFPPFPPLLFSTPLTACVFISVALSFLLSCLSLHPCPSSLPICLCLFMLTLVYVYLIIHAGHFIHAFAHFTLITPVMPLGLTLFMLYSSHTCHFMFYLCSPLPIKLLCYSVGSLYSCSGTSD